MDKDPLRLARYLYEQLPFLEESIGMGNTDKAMRQVKHLIKKSEELYETMDDIDSQRPSTYHVRKMLPGEAELHGSELRGKIEPPVPKGKIRIPDDMKGELSHPDEKYFFADTHFNTNDEEE